MKSSFEKCIGTDKIDKQDLFDRARGGTPKAKQHIHTIYGNIAAFTYFFFKRCRQL